MGRLVKCHWARLIVLSAAVCQIMAALLGYFWPRMFLEFMTKSLSVAVKPFPSLQTVNLVFGILVCAWEWPLGLVAGSTLHRSIVARLIFLPITILSSALMYQSTNPAIYYTVGLIVYFWAYSEGEAVRTEDPMEATHQAINEYHWSLSTTWQATC
ncbi:hypothetical protein GcM3_030025 [Golovinomyces cichoracearum]|uniref:DUF7727 domain-containing protein n=1 Tax=Golovinomyces cichoracearum TaxID=62708 RepID=A0A420J530_9PEZI|nr:hypothetical protein GcM3_030025 [Golovinomyces cichoracearum]